MRVMGEAAPSDAFNRTILELKLIDDHCLEIEKASFNRTILELKLQYFIRAVGQFHF